MTKQSSCRERGWAKRCEASHQHRDLSTRGSEVPQLTAAQHGLVPKGSEVQRQTVAQGLVHKWLRGPAATLHACFVYIVAPGPRLCSQLYTNCGHTQTTNTAARHTMLPKACEAPPASPSLRKQACRNLCVSTTHTSWPHHKLL